MPNLTNQAPSLDSLLLDLDALWGRFKMSSEPTDYLALRAQCTALEHRLTTWVNGQAPEAQPTPVINLGCEDESSVIAVGRWPGRVDTYSDLYTAGVWNIARAARLMLLMLHFKISNSLDGPDHNLGQIPAAGAIAADIMASVPYHLADNLHHFIKAPESEAMNPGRTLGGLLLMHPLYIVCYLPFVSESIKDYARRCLLWIADNMGIGYAERLTKVCNTSSLPTSLIAK